MQSCAFSCKSMCVCPAFCCAELPLIEAVKAGDLKRLQLELTAGADLNATDPHGRGSAVSYAASLGREECLQALLEAGADPEVRTEVPFLNISMTPLYAAAHRATPAACGCCCSMGLPTTRGARAMAPPCWELPWRGTGSA